jgi:hypothetical protein
MAALLKQNYGLESLPDIHLEHRPGDVDAVMRLNESGHRPISAYRRRILHFERRQSQVLSAVSNEMNCVFFHPLENLTLSDRSAVEAAASDTTVLYR